MPSSPNGTASMDLLNDDEVLAVLAGCRLSTKERFGVLALVCQRWRRLVCLPDLVRQGVTACIQSNHVERLQSLRRWLRAHAGALQSFEIILSAAGGTEPGKAAVVELGRCLAAACLGGAVRELRIEWRPRTQLLLGHGLAFGGVCGSLRRLTLCAARDTIQLACPLARLTALESATIHGGPSRWGSQASLPASLTSLTLIKATDASGTQLPTQLSVLSRLCQLSLSCGMDLPAEGYSVLAALSSLCRLSLGRAAYWPAVLSELTTLRYLDLHSCGWRMGPAASGQAMQERLEGISSGLTGLCLQSGLPQLPAPGAALSDSLQLQLLLDERPTFQPAHWPDSLRAAWATWRQLLKEPLGPGITPELRYLSIQYCWSTNWSLAAQQPSWAALWAWLERAPNLRLLEILGFDYQELPMVLSTALYALKRRRPGLRVATARNKWGSQPFLDTAAALCDPDQA